MMKNSSDMASQKTIIRFSGKFCCFVKEVINFVNHAMKTMPSHAESHKE